LKPEPTLPHDPREIPPLKEPSGAPERGQTAVEHDSSADPDRPLPRASAPKSVVSLLGSAQAASEIRPKDSEAVGHPGDSPGIASKDIDSAATAESPDCPGHHPGRSETREAISPPRAGPPQLFHIEARQSNPSRVDATILRKSASKDPGATKSIPPSPAVPATVEVSPSGGNQVKSRTQPAEIDPLHPTPAPSDRQGQEKSEPDTPQLSTPSILEATPPRSGRGSQAIAPRPAADRLHSQKNGTRIAIGRIEVQVNNHPQPVAAGKSAAQPASREINLESRFLGRFVLGPT
jgi:hypothetical protein